MGTILVVSESAWIQRSRQTRTAAYRPPTKKTTRLSTTSTRPRWTTVRRVPARRPSTRRPSGRRAPPRSRGRAASKKNHHHHTAEGPAENPETEHHGYQGPRQRKPAATSSLTCSPALWTSNRPRKKTPMPRIWSSTPGVRFQTKFSISFQKTFAHQRMSLFFLLTRRISTPTDCNADVPHGRRISRSNHGWGEWVTP